MLLHIEDLQFACTCQLWYLNYSGKRSFSKMALIKNKLLRTMSDGQLSVLELLSVENDILGSVSFKDN